MPVLLTSMPELFTRDIDGVNPFIVIPFVALAVFALQFFCCWKWDSIFIRLLPAIAATGCIVCFYVLMTKAPDLELARDYLEYLIESAIMLGTTFIGWIAWIIFCYVHNKSGRNPAGY